MSLIFWPGYPPQYSDLLARVCLPCLRPELSPPSVPGELCDEVIDHCVPELNLCQHEAKCIPLDKGFR